MRKWTWCLVVCAGCNSILGIGSPGKSSDDVPGDAGADAPLVEEPPRTSAISGMTSIGPTPALPAGSIRIVDPRLELGRAVCSQDSSICIRGGLTP